MKSDYNIIALKMHEIKNQFMEEIANENKQHSEADRLCSVSCNNACNSRRDFVLKIAHIFSGGLADESCCYQKSESLAWHFKADFQD